MNYVDFIKRYALIFLVLVLMFIIICFFGWFMFSDVRNIFSFVVVYFFFVVIIVLGLIFDEKEKKVLCK